MLNITMAAAPAQPNQITLFFFPSFFFFSTSAASQHGLRFQARHRTRADSARGREDGGTLALILRGLIGIPLQVSSLYVIWEKKGWFLKRRFLTDKGDRDQGGPGD